ncbi:hypothetical protein [Ensifer soli]|uniref:hypothetical protein n=1 Tax=Ciceribacter sp. sgz301302 TaxID=3342379 RepID=UPI0035BA5AAC
MTTTDDAHPTPLPPRLLRYRLTPADALAFTSCPREIRGFSAFGMMLWFGAGGFVIAMLPDDLNLLMRALCWLVTGLVWYGLYTAFLTLGAHRAARRLVRLPQDVVLACDPTGLVETRDGSRHAMTLERIGAVSRLDGRIVVEGILADGRRGAIIVPAAAFKDGADADAFMDGLDRASAAAQP